MILEVKKTEDEIILKAEDIDEDKLLRKLNNQGYIITLIDHNGNIFQYNRGF